MKFKEAFMYNLEKYGDRWADPIQLRRDLLRASSGRAWQWVAEARQIQEELKQLFATPPSDDENAEAQKLAMHAKHSMDLAEIEGNLVQCAYSAFGITPLDPSNGVGIVEEEMQAILKEYLEYAEGKG